MIFGYRNSDKKSSNRQTVRANSMTNLNSTLLSGALNSPRKIPSPILNCTSLVRDLQKADNIINRENLRNSERVSNHSVSESIETFRNNVRKHSQNDKTEKE